MQYFSFFARISICVYNIEKWPYKEAKIIFLKEVLYQRRIKEEGNKKLNFILLHKSKLARVANAPKKKFTLKNFF
jgi:hypothetical protein